MATQIIAGQVLEVPLPADYQDATCLPTVILQPTSDQTNYMLKSVFATNGEPGVVDHAILADTIEILPKHGPQHLSTGDDPIPDAVPGLDGLMPAGNGQVGSYYAGDCELHTLPALTQLFSEGTVNLTSGMAPGIVLFVGTITNPNAGIYFVEYPYLYNPSSTTPVGMVHWDVYDPVAAAWVAITGTTDISALTSQTFLLRPTLLSAAIIRVFQAAPNALQWRLVLDTPGGVNASFQVGFRFSLAGLQAL